MPSGVIDVEFVRDVRPILQRACAGCHTKDAPSSPGPPGQLALDDMSLYQGIKDLDIDRRHGCDGYGDANRRRDARSGAVDAGLAVGGSVCAHDRTAVMFG